MNRTVGRILGATVAALIGVSAAGGVVAAQPPSPAAASSATYTVRSGDSLIVIARRLGVRLAALLDTNAITATTAIHPGDTLKVPVGATTPITAPAPAPVSAPAAAATVPYVVTSGDALASIARQHGVRLGALVKANAITVTTVIHAGQTLQIPPATLPIPAPRALAAPPATAAGPAPTASAPTTSTQSMLAYARAQVGKPYKFFSAGPETFDCSGLVVAAYKQVVVTLPHQSRALSTIGTAVDYATSPIVAGDLVFTAATSDPTRISHVGVALDGSTWIQAVGPGRPVRIGPLPAPEKIFAVRRLPQP